MNQQYIFKYSILSEILTEFLEGHTKRRKVTKIFSKTIVQCMWKRFQTIPYSMCYLVLYQKLATCTVPAAKSYSCCDNNRNVESCSFLLFPGGASGVTHKIKLFDANALRAMSVQNHYVIIICLLLEYL